MIKGLTLELFKKYKGIELPYKDLPKHAKNSIDVYYKDEYEIQVYDDDIFGYVKIPVEELKFAIIIGDYNDEHHKDFDAYHKDYMSGGDIPSHENVWAILLSDNEREVIFDGWHRFHSYIEKGIEFIPCVSIVKMKSLINMKE